MNESGLWNRIKNHYDLVPKNTRELSRIENSVARNTLDVWFCLYRVQGWCELKYLQKFPRAGIVKLPKYKLGQRRRIKRLNEIGALAILCLGVDDEIFWHVDNAHLIGLLTEKDLRRTAVATGLDGLKTICKQFNK